MLEAFADYWRRTPAVKKLVFRVIPDETTRLAALKRGEGDITYSIRGELAEEVRRTPNLELKPIVLNGTQWLYFPDQWDVKSPWHDVRVRRAASLALNRDEITRAALCGMGGNFQIKGGFLASGSTRSPTQRVVDMVLAHRTRESAPAVLAFIETCKGLRA